MKMRKHYCPECGAPEHYFHVETEEFVTKEGIVAAVKETITCERCEHQFTWHETRKEVVKI